MSFSDLPPHLVERVVSNALGSAPGMQAAGNLASLSSDFEGAVRSAWRAAYRGCRDSCVAQPFLPAMMMEGQEDARLYMQQLSRPAVAAAARAEQEVAAARATGDAAAMAVAMHVAAQSVRCPMYHPWAAQRGVEFGTACTHFEMPLRHRDIDYVVRGSYLDAVPHGWLSGWVWSVRRDTGNVLPDADITILGGGAVPARMRVELSADSDYPRVLGVCSELISALRSVFGRRCLPRLPDTVEMGWMEDDEWVVGVVLPLPTSIIMDIFP